MLLLLFVTFFSLSLLQLTSLITEISRNLICTFVANTNYALLFVGKNFSSNIKSRLFINGFGFLFRRSWTCQGGVLFFEAVPNVDQDFWVLFR